MLKFPSSYYITTPIYYVNDKPHIGHAYTTILADVLSRYYRLLKVPTFFLTGTDEHGQKVAQAAAKNNISPLKQCDTTVIRFQDLWRKLEITNDDFIRTTEEKHKKVVGEILQMLYDRNEIYKHDYEGFYCVPCERFYTEKDLTQKSCPECKRGVKKLLEANYFFKMGKYQQWLIDYIHTHPEFIQPDHRRNETLGFLRKPLGDLCISRPKARLSWGIELPFDQNYVCYVWFDALINYISAIGYGTDNEKFNKWWPASCHLIGKDILTTHSVYWPTMLRAMGVDMPKSIFAHGWWLSGRDKMGKSLGNVIDPMQVCDDYGVDPFRYYLLAEMTLGQDVCFSETSFIERYNTDLAGGLGNMLNRVIRLINRYFNGKVPSVEKELGIDKKLKVNSLDAVQIMEHAITEMKLDRGLEGVMRVVRECNRYFEQTKPWDLAKNADFDRLATVLYTAIESLRIISALLYPVIPAKMAIMRQTLGINSEDVEPVYHELTKWGQLIPGTQIGDIQSLFPRIDDGKSKQQTLPRNRDGKIIDRKRKKSNKHENIVEFIDVSQFSQIQLKTARVLTAEKVQNADRLLKLDVEVGEEHRQIVAGIANDYTPEDLVDKIIVIVANLKPAKIRGIQSEGMLLAAKRGDKLNLVTVDSECNSGLNIG